VHLAAARKRKRGFRGGRTACAGDSRRVTPPATPTTLDVELLYRHFDFPRTAVGFCDYWVTMQELWASSRWVHSRIITSADELSRITAGDGWDVVHQVQAYEPAIVLTSDSAQLAVLLQSPLRRFAIHLEQIEISADHAVRYGESLLVASGPRGYLI